MVLEGSTSGDLQLLTRLSRSTVCRIIGLSDKNVAFLNRFSDEMVVCHLKTDQRGNYGFIDIMIFYGVSSVNNIYAKWYTNGYMCQQIVRGGIGVNHKNITTQIAP